MRRVRLGMGGSLLREFSPYVRVAVRLLIGLDRFSIIPDAQSASAFTRKDVSTAGIDGPSTAATSAPVGTVSA